MKQIVIKLVVLATLLGFGYGCIYIHQLLTGFYRDHPSLECVPEKIIIFEYKAFSPPGEIDDILVVLDNDDHALDIQKIMQGIKESRNYVLSSKIPWKYKLQLVCGNASTNNVFIACKYIGLHCNDIPREKGDPYLSNYRASRDLFYFVDKLVEEQKR